MFKAGDTLDQSQHSASSNRASSSTNKSGSERKKARLCFGTRSESKTPTPTTQDILTPSDVPLSTSVWNDSPTSQNHFIPWPAILTPTNPKSGPRPFPEWILTTSTFQLDEPTQPTQPEQQTTITISDDEDDENHHDDQDDHDRHKTKNKSSKSSSTGDNIWDMFADEEWDMTDFDSSISSLSQPTVVHSPQTVNPINTNDDRNTASINHDTSSTVSPTTTEAPMAFDPLETIVVDITESDDEEQIDSIYDEKSRPAKAIIAAPSEASSSKSTDLSKKATAIVSPSKTTTSSTSQSNRTASIAQPSKTPTSASIVSSSRSESLIVPPPRIAAEMETKRSAKLTPPSPLSLTLDLISSAPNTSSNNDSDTLLDEVLPRVAINRYTKDKTPIYIHPHFVRYLKKHQIAGIQFMWNQLIGESNGCVLAHCMGLGKTLQVVVVVTTLFIEIEKGNTNIPKDLSAKRILILAPLITLTNWMNEFDRWVRPDMSTNITHIFRSSDLAGIRDDRRLEYVRRWYNDGGIMLMNYDKFRHMVNASTKASSLMDYESMLLKPSLVILDEAHRIKNAMSALTKCVNKIVTPRRICLTGYPLQNNLSEYYCMLDFIFPGLLGDEKLFKLTFQRPIEAIFEESSAGDQYLARSQLLTLQLLTNDFIHRKDATILNKELPGKTEYYISCKLTSLQHQLYAKMLDRNLGRYEFLFAIMILRSICNHPAVFKKIMLKNSYKRFGSAALIDDAAEVTDQDECALMDKFADQYLKDWKNFDEGIADIEDWGNSHKTRMVLSICEIAKELNEKVIIVSHSIVNLDYLEAMLRDNEFVISRIDGSTPQNDRQPIIDQFNDDDSHDIMLLSAKAGGIGVNITSASRMILTDTDWNPSYDEQSIGRIYRFGQKKHVYIYHLLTYSTIESKMIALGHHKRNLSLRVVDNKLTKLQARSDLYKYFCAPQEDPGNLVTPAEMERVGDPILKAALLAEKDSVVELNPAHQASGADALDTLSRVALSPEQLTKVRTVAGNMLKNAKAHHMHALNTFHSGEV